MGPHQILLLSPGGALGPPPPARHQPSLGPRFCVWEVAHSILGQAERGTTKCQGLAPSTDFTMETDVIMNNIVA